MLWGGIIMAAAGLAAFTAPTAPRVEAGVFKPANDVEQLMVMAAEDPKHRAAYGRAFLDAQICAATTGDRAPGGQTLAAGDKVSLRMAPLADGRQATALFTSAERVAEVYGAGTPYLCLRGEDLLEMVMANPVALNPGLPHGVVWSSDDIRRFIGAAEPWRVKAETHVNLGLPTVTPTDLLQRLKTSFAARPEIAQAWLALAYWTERKEWTWYLDVRTDLPREQFNAVLRDAVKGADFQGKPMDSHVSPPGGPEGVGFKLVER